jgi:hypothetical protein
MNESTDMPSAPFFVAYIYPGWHWSPYRPDVNEWELLDKFEPYFDDHQPPPRPLEGYYDDAKPETALKQIEIAKSFGINAFSYFLYYEPEQFVLSEPIDIAFQTATEVSDFKISLTWCIRLPHNEFPLRLMDKENGAADEHRSRNLNEGIENRERRSKHKNISPENIPLEFLTLEDIEHLLGEQVFDEIAVGAFFRSLKM